MSDLISRESVRAGRIPYDEDLTEYQRGWNDACDAIADNAPEAQRDHNASYSRSHENDPISRQTAMDFVGSMEMCDEISAEAYQKLMNYLEELPSAQPEQRWIPCSEGLPEVHETGNSFSGVYMQSYPVLVYGVPEGEEECGFHVVTYCDDLNGYTYWSTELDAVTIDGVRAWMPLPEPYAERREE